MIYELLSRSFGSNCYLVVDEKVALIDSGMDPMSVLEKVSKLNIDVNFLINTHCHLDHIAGNSEIKSETGAKIAAFGEDAEAMNRNDTRLILSGLFGRQITPPKVDIVLDDGQTIDLGGTKLEVIHTPGHSRGSISLYEPSTKSLFSGDTIFSGDVGRTDLPGGDWGQLGKSIQKLIKLHDKRGIGKLYSGHGPVGTGKGLKDTYHLYF